MDGSRGPAKPPRRWWTASETPFAHPIRPAPARAVSRARPLDRRSPIAQHAVNEVIGHARHHVAELARLRARDRGDRFHPDADVGTDSCPDGSLDVVIVVA